MTSPPGEIDLDTTASHTWSLFVDWCTATGHIALPAQPETLAEFLADHPARVSTHRRRVTAINSAHRQCGFSEPGRSQAVHAALATRRHERLQTVADILDEAIRQLPINGWPHGLFGRRDALILTLVAAGLTYAEIARLRRGDLRRHGHELLIDSDRKWRLGTVGDPLERGPAAVHDRWSRVQEILDGYPTIRVLAHYFEHPPETAADRPAAFLSAAAAEQPLIVSIDRWGYTPLRPTPMTDQSIAAITRTQVSGQAPTHRRRTPLPRPIIDAKVGAACEDGDETVTLDPRYYRRGVTARRRAQAWLTTVGDELDGVASRAEELLEQLAGIVGEAYNEPTD
jgi:DNA-binding CsgD family transcriptional regulator